MHSGADHLMTPGMSACAREQARTVARMNAIQLLSRQPGWTIGSYRVDVTEREEPYPEAGEGYVLYTCIAAARPA